MTFLGHWKKTFDFYIVDSVKQFYPWSPLSSDLSSWRGTLGWPPSRPHETVSKWRWGQKHEMLTNDRFFNYTWTEASCHCHAWLQEWRQTLEAFQLFAACERTWQPWLFSNPETNIFNQLSGWLVIFTQPGLAALPRSNVVFWGHCELLGVFLKRTRWHRCRRWPLNLQYEKWLRMITEYTSKDTITWLPV